ncbi:cobyric acid synthase [mine drainage metagenome]|uniref:Cobyric acid synthase n=1 Tax=mine drainage metagenome TaxID=410659 RepID=A0A1J5QI52_9ZZZZ
MSGALLVAGTTSDAGKSVITAGLCRWLAREGVRVVPFKAQNMSLNSMVTRDGSEIGRAQAMQAAAAGVEPEAAMNPVLLKPGSDNSSQVVLLGKPVAEVNAMNYRDIKPRLLETVLESLADLRRRFDVVICEGAGSPTEINLRDRDIANMGLARAANLPVVVVGDIDRGGLFAALHGTVALLDREDQALISGFIVNKFRGDQNLLAPGLAMIKQITGRDVFGVVPWRSGLDLDVEDSLDLKLGNTSFDAEHIGADLLRIAVIRLPRISNVTDADALASEPGVVLRFADRPDDLLDADLVIIPGTRATVSDLTWLRQRGLDEALRDRVRKDRPTIGLCGGFQMLASVIDDPYESGAGVVAGLNLLPARVRFGSRKVLALPEGRAFGEVVRGYEIHHGVVDVEGGEPFLDGCRVGAVFGTTWHGIFENDGFRRAFLTEIATMIGSGFKVAPDTSFAAVRQRRLDLLGDLVADHMDTAAIWRLIENGPTPGLPFIPPGALT